MSEPIDEKRADLFELYAENPDKADEVVFGRETHKDRRGFLRGAGLASMGALIGTAIPFHRNMPAGFIPEALAANPMKIEGKDGLTILNDRPVNAETPAHLLNDDVTPTPRHFIRNNGNMPESMDAASWNLRIDGLVDNAMSLSIGDLKQKFEVVTERLVIECGGNGRAAFDPPARGNQWTLGAVACSEWTGVRLADVLKAAGVKNNAIYTAHEGGGYAFVGQRGQVSSVARCARRQGDESPQPDCLRHERQGNTSHERGAFAPGRAWMARVLFTEMA